MQLQLEKELDLEISAVVRRTYDLSTGDSLELINLLVRLNGLLVSHRQVTRPSPDHLVYHSATCDQQEELLTSHPRGPLGA